MWHPAFWHFILNILSAPTSICASSWHALRNRKLSHHSYPTHLICMCNSCYLDGRGKHCSVKMPKVLWVNRWRLQLATHSGSSCLRCYVVFKVRERWAIFHAILQNAQASWTIGHCRSPHGLNRTNFSCDDLEMVHDYKDGSYGALWKLV